MTAHAPPPARRRGDAARRRRHLSSTGHRLVALACVLAACGADGGDSADGAVAGPATLDRLPGGLVVEAFAAGDDEAWLVGSSGGMSRLFAVRADGVVRTAHDGRRHVLGLAPFGRGAVVTNLRCGDGRSPTSEACGRTEGVVSFVGDDGTVDDEVVVWSEDGPAAPTATVALLGVSRSAAWVGLRGEYVEVEPDGVARRAPRVDGTIACVVDDELYAVGPSRGPAPVAWRWAGDAWVGVTGTTAAPPTTSSPDTSITAPPAPDPAGPAGPNPTAPGAASSGPVPADGPRSRDVSCIDEGVDVVRVGDPAHLLGRWTPDVGYVAADPAGGPPPSRPTTAAGGHGAFAVDVTGQLLERGADGHFRPSGVEVGGFDDPTAWPGIHADASADLVAACVGPHRDGAHTCHLASRTADPP